MERNYEIIEEKIARICEIYENNPIPTTITTTTTNNNNKKRKIIKRMKKG